MDSRIRVDTCELTRLFWKEIEAVQREGSRCPQLPGLSVCECPKTLEQIRTTLPEALPMCSQHVCPVRVVLGDELH